MIDYECDGQMNIFECARLNDFTYDRNGKGHPAPEWMCYERCENCLRWAKYPTDEQPPAGWGCIGFCAEHNQRVKVSSYCMKWEDKNGLGNS